MSEEKIPIQTSSLDELLGAQHSLPHDEADRKSTHGGNFDQVMRSFPPSPNVEPGSAGLIAPAGNTRPVESVDSFYCAAPVKISVKPVDARNIEGSYKGDTRSKPGDTAAASLRTASGSDKDPRSEPGQAPAGARIPSAPAPVSFPPDSDDLGG